MANFNSSARTFGAYRTRATTPADDARAQRIIGTLARQGNLDNWAIDLGTRVVQHRSGLRIRFVRRAGDWYPIVLLPVPAPINTAAIGGLTRAAMERFLDALMQTKDTANNRAAPLYR